MKKYIIIVSVYDQENTQAYPLGGIFDYHATAEKYIADHWREVKNDHWAKDCVNGKDFYKEEFTIGGGWCAQDTSCGESIEITIHEVPVMSQQVPCAFVDRDDLENRGWDASKLSDEDMESIASKMEDYILDKVDYWTAMKAACEDMKVPYSDSIRAHLNDVLVDDGTGTGGTAFAGETLFEFLSCPFDPDLEGINEDDDVSVLDDILRKNGIMPIRRLNNLIIT